MIYENNRTRELKTLAWVPIPNSHDGDGYTALVSHKDGAGLLGGWVACVQVASRCDPRGTLMRRSRTPHDAASLSRITRLPEIVFERVFIVAVSECNWLTVEEFQIIPQEGAIIPQEGAQNRTEGNGTEQKGMERKESKYSRMAIPNIEEVKLFCAKSGISESDAVAVWHKWDGNGWTNGGKPIRKWTSTLISWKNYGYLPSQKGTNAKTNAQPRNSGAGGNSATPDYSKGF